METVGWGGLWDAHPSPSWEVGDKVNRADLTKLGHWEWVLGQIRRLGWVQHGEWDRANSPGWSLVLGCAGLKTGCDRGGMKARTQIH